MTRTGRPKLPKDERLATTLRLRVTKAEYKAICAAAKKAGVSVSEYVRDKTLKH